MAHFIRDRETWIDPTLPFTNVINGKGELYRAPLFRGWARITDCVIHYPGADWKDLGWEDFNLDGKIDIQDTITLIRNAHRSYLLGSRGYSLGYGFYVGVLGDIWEVRGWEYSNAANLGLASMGKDKWNNYSISIHVVVNIVGGVAQPANALQVAAVNWLIDRLEAEKGAPFLEILTHGMGDNTACAGAGLNNQVTKRIIWRGKSTLPPVIPTPPGGPVPPAPEERETAYLWRNRGYANAWLCGVGAADHLTPETFKYLSEVIGLPLFAEVHPQKLRQCLTQSGLTTNDLVTTADGQ